MYADDTITAISTPPGQGGVGIVRISGREATAILARLFQTPKPPENWESHRLTYGVLRDSAGLEIDRCLAVLMRAPNSYTGEDIVELHCHGGPVLLHTAVAAVLACGARLAEPGEFTKRAFLNGRMDLSQAEAVVDAITAGTPQAANLAVRQLAGTVSSWINDLREQVIRLKALIEAQIDFSEEDFTVEAAALLSQLDKCEMPLAAILSTYEHGKLIRDGLRVAIVGKPNVGKSSLLNALLGEDRAIVTPIAGTTRDTIEEALVLDGIPFVLADTAGLRDRQRADAVEELGMERTLGSIEAADVVLVVIDAAQPLTVEDQTVLATTSSRRRLIGLNKSDLPAQVLGEGFAGERVATISAKDHVGFDDLRRMLVEAATDHVPPNDTPIITRSRHQIALRQAAESLALVRHSIIESRPPDVIAVDVQDALDYLGAVTGVVTSEDVLDRIFKEFCVGK